MFSFQKEVHTKWAIPPMWLLVGVLHSSHSVPTRPIWTSQRHPEMSWKTQTSRFARLSFQQSWRVSSATSWCWTRPAGRGWDTSWCCSSTTMRIDLCKHLSATKITFLLQIRRSASQKQLKAFKLDQQRSISTPYPLTLAMVGESTRWQTSKEWQQRRTFSRCRRRRENARLSFTIIAGLGTCCKNATALLGSCLTIG